MKNCINWNRIIGVAGLTLCTTFLATGYETIPSIINACLIAGVALFTELKFESEPVNKALKVINRTVIL